MKYCDGTAHGKESSRMCGLLTIEETKLEREKEEEVNRSVAGM